MVDRSASPRGTQASTAEPKTAPWVVPESALRAEAGQPLPRPSTPPELLAPPAEVDYVGITLRYIGFPDSDLDSRIEGLESQLAELRELRWHPGAEPGAFQGQGFSLGSDGPVSPPDS